MVGVIVIVATLTLPTSADASGTAGQSFSSTPGSNQSSVQPDWNHEAIRDCAYSYAGSERFNLMFTCICLKRGAENQDESDAADAQCEQAKSYYPR